MVKWSYSLHEGDGGAEILRLKKISPESAAKKFHFIYEKLAPTFGYRTRKASAVPWVELPESNKRLMIATCEEFLRWLVAK